jgi:hypothetical protein
MGPFEIKIRETIGVGELEPSAERVLDTIEAHESDRLKEQLASLTEVVVGLQRALLQVAIEIDGIDDAPR